MPTQRILVTALFLSPLALLPASQMALAQSAADLNAQAIAASQQATQQSMQAAQQATNESMRASQEAAERSMREMQQSQDALNAQNNLRVPGTWPPKISVKSGKYPGPITVKLTSRTRGAIMYYRTDGWSPTTKSQRYEGPITISSNTTLQVIAVAPHCLRSPVTIANYVIASNPTAAQAAGPSAEPVAAGTRDAQSQSVRFTFAQAVSSNTAEIGDKIPLILAEDLFIAGKLVAAKGTPGSATVMQVDKTGHGGAPGELEFRVNALQTPNGEIPLRGEARLEGQAQLPNAAFLIPVVDFYQIARHGKDAVVPVGMPITAVVAPVETARNTPVPD